MSQLLLVKLASSDSSQAHYGCNTYFDVTNCSALQNQIHGLALFVLGKALHVPTCYCNRIYIPEINANQWQRFQRLMRDEIDFGLDMPMAKVRWVFTHYHRHQRRGTPPPVKVWNPSLNAGRRLAEVISFMRQHRFVSDEANISLSDTGEMKITGMDNIPQALQLRLQAEILERYGEPVIFDMHNDV